VKKKDLAAVQKLFISGEASENLHAEKYLSADLLRYGYTMRYM
jgi:hypothetical protein